MTAAPHMRRRPPKVPRPTPVPRTRSALIDRLAAEDVAMFWDRVADRLPLVETLPGEAGSDEVIVTFCWRDDAAEQVLLFANRLTDETSLTDTLLERLPGTDLWHASFRMGRDWRASYSFLVHPAGGEAPWLVDGHVALRAALDHGRPDPRNPERCTNRAGQVQSVASMPDAPAQRWHVPRTDGAQGTVEATRRPDGREVWLYRPAGRSADAVGLAGAGSDPLPLLIALDGEVWVRWLPAILDNLIAAGEIPSTYAVLPASGGVAARWAELGTGGDGVAYLTDELIAWVAGRLPVDADRVVVAGQSLGGLTALRAALARPDMISAAVSHSASLWQDDLSDLVKAAGAARTAGASGGGERRARIHLAHGKQEWVLDGPHRDLAARLDAAGIESDVAHYNGGHDYACWRVALADGLRWALQ